MKKVSDIIVRTLMCTILALGSISLVITGVRAAEEEALTDAQVKALIIGKRVTFSGGGTATYNTDGSYKHSMSQVDGRYTISGGKVCVEFDNDWRRCDRYVKKGDRYYLINGNGQRFRAKIK